MKTITDIKLVFRKISVSATPPQTVTLKITQKPAISLAVLQPRGVQGVQGIQGVQGERGYFTINEIITEHNAPVLVASFILEAKTYQNVGALIGCANPAYSVTLEIKTQDGAVLTSLTKTGLVSWSSAASFTLTETSEIFLIITATGVAFIKGLSL